MPKRARNKIELSPVPKKKSRKLVQNTHYPCVVCKVDVDNPPSDCIQCDSCSSWVHISCDGLLPEHSKLLSGNAPYTCRTCILNQDDGFYSFHNGLDRLDKVMIFIFILKILSASSRDRYFLYC